MSVCIRCPRCDSAFAIEDTRPSAEVRCDACGVLLGHVADADTRVDQPIVILRVSTLRGFAGEVECAAISPDGKFLAAGLNDGIIALRDPSAPRVRGKCAGHRGKVAAVAFSPTGSTLASGGEDGVIRLWEVTKGRPWTLSGVAKGTALIGHTGPIWSLAFSPDGRSLISGSGEAEEHGGFLTGFPKSTTYTGEIKTWDVASGRERAGPEGVTGWIRSVAIAPDGRTLAAATLAESGPRVMLWDLESRRLRGTLDPEAWVPSIAFSPEGAARWPPVVMTERSNSGIRATVRRADRSPCWAGTSTICGIRFGASHSHPTASSWPRALGPAECNYSTCPQAEYEPSSRGRGTK